MMRVLHIYSGKIYTQTGVSTVLKTFLKINWSSVGINSAVYALDSINNYYEMHPAKPFRGFRNSTRFHWLKPIARNVLWNLSRRNSFWFIFYYIFLYRRNSRCTIKSAQKLLNSSDIVFCHDIWSAMELVKCYGNKKLKIYCVNHSNLDPLKTLVSIFPSLSGGRINHWLDERIKKLYSEITGVIVLTASAKSNLVNTRLVNDDFIHIVPNGIEDALIKYNFDEKSIHTTGTICDRKRQYLIPEICSNISNSELLGNNSSVIKYNIWGAGPDFEDLKIKIASIRSGLQIILHGYSSEPHKTYVCGDLFILLSKTEGLSVAAIEALRAGCILLLTNTGGAEKLVSDEGGWVIHEQDDSSIIDSATVKILEWLQFDYDERVRRGMISRKNYELNFSMQKMMENYASIVNPR